MDKKQKVKKILKILKNLYPEAKIELNYTKPFELLAAVILSAQATDKKVNEVTKFLFGKYKSVKDYANVPVSEFEQDIKSINLYINKAKNIIGTAKVIDENFGGKIPDSMEELIKFPGVGKKTANIILANLFAKAEGIAVDTHVARLSRLFGLSREKDPNKIEKDLMEIVPRFEWLELNHRFVLYGRYLCPAHCKHTACPLKEFIV